MKILFPTLLLVLLSSCYVKIKHDSLETWTVKRVKKNGLLKIKGREGVYSYPHADTLHAGSKLQVVVNSTKPHVQDIIRVDTLHLRKLEPITKK